MLFARFEVCIEDTTLTARAWGEAIDIAKHQPAVEVKGATLTNLAVRRDDNGNWLAQCVVDV
jgi:SHS2 domain-containing protein